MVQRDIDKLNIPVIEGSSMAAIQIFHITNIILADTSRFTFIGSISEAMLRNVPIVGDVMRTYRSLLASGLQPITDVVCKVLEEADKPKKGGKKRTAKVGTCKTAQTPKKKVKRAANKPWTPMPSDHEDLQSNMVSDIPVQYDVHLEHYDIIATSHPQVSDNNEP